MLPPSTPSWFARYPGRFRPFLKCKYSSSQRESLRLGSSCRIRSAFLDYFANLGHKVVPSSSLIPQHHDDSLLFTNAGMVQFKNYFIDPSSAPFPSMTSVQRCVRAGGKHNDFETVGHSSKHQTFFEMLGNFSFGGYDNAASIDSAWKFLTRVVRLPKDRLKVTVLESDITTYNVWKDQIGLPPSSIIRLGPSDNWWSMGDTGPCGPCTEIFWDNESPTNPLEWTEIWNIVFMQFYQPPGNGPLETLKVPCIDTGMGLERLCSILDGSMDNYKTDLLAPLVHSARSFGTLPSSDPAHYRIIADQFKCSIFLLCDGVIPSPSHRGYVLRKIIRRAVRSSNVIGLASLETLSKPLLDIYPAKDFPDIHDRIHQIMGILLNEEHQARILIKQTSQAVDRFINKQPSAEHPSKRVIPAKLVFDMYSSQGFPLDVIESVLLDRGWTVNMQQVNEHIHAHQEASTSENKASTSSPLRINPSILSNSQAQQEFVGYDTTTTSSITLAVNRPTAVDEQSPSSCLVVINPNPFYAFGGGQKPDIGVLKFRGLGAGHDISVPCRAILLDNDTVGLELSNIDPSFQICVGDRVTAEVNPGFREGVASHHSATHLLQWALRSLLGPKVVQAGSQVDHDRLTFDFSHSKAVTESQLLQVQDLVNTEITRNHVVDVQQKTREAAINEGAIMLFTEKYNAESVRSVKLGPSHELCRGTHVSTTHTLSPFVIVKERSIGSGVRRIEAMCGPSALVHIEKMQGTIRGLANALGQTGHDGLVAHVKQVQQSIKKLKSAHKAFVDQVVKYHLGTESWITVGDADCVFVLVQHIHSHLGLEYVNRRLNWIYLNRNQVHSCTWSAPKEGAKVPVVLITYLAQVTAVMLDPTEHYDDARIFVGKIGAYFRETSGPFRGCSAVESGSLVMATVKLAAEGQREGAENTVIAPEDWETAIKHVCDDQSSAE